MEDLKKAKNREYQRKHREMKLNELGVDEYRKKIAQQVAKHRENKKDTQFIYNKINESLNKLPNEELIKIKRVIDERTQPPTNNMNNNNKKYCEVCNIFVFHSNISRHNKTIKHLSKINHDQEV